MYYYIGGVILFMREYVHNAPAGQEGELDPLMLEFTGIYDMPKVGTGNWIQVLTIEFQVFLPLNRLSICLMGFQ